MDRPYREQVAKGIALLNEKRPGWRQRIDLSKLSLGRCTRCVLGQEFGFDLPTNDNAYKALQTQYNAAYIKGVRDLGLAVDGAASSFVAAIAHGFTINTTHDCRSRQEAWAELTAEWVRQLTEPVQKKFPQIRVDPTLIAHTSNPEYQKLKPDPTMDALRDRTIKIDVPFLKEWEEKRRALEQCDEPTIVEPK